jgi:hypothetical protein
VLLASSYVIAGELPPTIFLVFVSPDSLLRRRCPRQEETASASHQFEFRERGRIAAGSGDRAIDREQDSGDAEVVRRVQKRGRPAGDQGDRPKAAGEDAEVSDSGKGAAIQKTKYGRASGAAAGAARKSGGRETAGEKQPSTRTTGERRRRAIGQPSVCSRELQALTVRNLFTIYGAAVGNNQKLFVTE